ncbi:MAG: DUF2026 family protein [Novosphingobium sp.]
MGKFLLTLPEYNRIHQVAHGVIKEVGFVEKACTFFAIFGSYVLNKHYGIASRPVAGGFSLCVADGPRCLIYGREVDDKFVWDGDGFHMWVQTATHVIDFSAPIYPEAFAEAQPDVAIPRKMLQKQMVDEKQSIAELSAIGEFISFPDPELSEELTDRFLHRPTNTDLLNVADKWFGSRRAKQRPSLAMGSNDGQIVRLALPAIAARGAW